jgi:L-threonylcarbamoyladenylate synthase
VTVRTEVLLVEPARPDPAAIARAAELLARGAVVAFPTETVYGLGCLPEHAEAVARIYALKGRPAERRLALYVAAPDDIARHAARISDEARRLIERFLAGETVGFRVSPHRVVTALIETVGRPLVGTSANLSGAASPTRAAEVLDAFRGRIEAVLDAGPTELGTDSTVIDAAASPPVILREGAVAAAEIAEALGMPLERVRRRSGPFSS